MKVARTVLSALAGAAMIATTVTVVPAHAAFPGQNTLIAFEREKSPGTGAMAIWTMKSDGTDQALLLEIGQSTTDPTWSPDMDPATAGYQGKIAFVSDGDIWTANADGSSPRNLTNSPTTSAQERDPAWSPDLDTATAGYQGRIAFASSRNPCPPGCASNEDVYTIDAAGGTELRLTDHVNSDRQPAWSPDGSKVVFFSNRPGAGLYVMDANGNNETEIRANTPDGVGTIASYPNWSPDGSQVAVNGDANHPGIRLVDFASGMIGGQLSDYPNSSGGLVNFPAWSPQGDKIAFMQRLAGAASNDFDIVVMSADGSNEVNLTGSALTRDEDPDWQPAAAPLDTIAPTVPKLAKPSVAFQKATSFAVSWSSTDSGVALGGTAGGTYYVRYRSATSINAALTPYVWWQKATTAKTAKFTGTVGSTYCFSAMARDKSGNVSGWSADKCTAIPLDDARMTPTGTWTRTTTGATGYYLNSYSASSASGATLQLANVQAKRLGLLVTKSVGAGTIQILWNGAVLQEVSLAAGSTVKKFLIQLTPFTTVQTGTVTIKVVSSGKRVEVDGLGVSAT